MFSGAHSLVLICTHLDSTELQLCFSALKDVTYNYKDKAFQCLLVLTRALSAYNCILIRLTEAEKNSRKVFKAKQLSLKGHKTTLAGTFQLII